MAWLTGWHKRKEITLSRATGAVTNYQMKLLVGESAGATGEDVDCGGKCLSTFNDLRFTAADGTTLLPYWIESITGATPNQLATVWIKFDSIGTDATTFYMYYGNSGASAASNGDDTFLFFDDFTGSSLDSDKWDTIGTPTITVSGGELDITQNDNTRGIRTKTATFTRNSSVRYKHKPYALGDRKGMACTGFGVYNETPTDWVGVAVYSSATSTLYGGCSTSSGRASTGEFAASTSYKTLESLWTSASVITLEDGVQKGVTLTTYIPSVSLKLSIGTCTFNSAWNTTNRSIYDWILVRQYLATEPAWGAWGAEEAATIEDTIGESANISAVMAPYHLMETVPESASISDVFVGQTLTATINESAGISDLMKGSDLYGVVGESASIDDVMARVYEVTRATSESASITDAIEGIPYKYESISESLVLVDTNQFAFSFNLTEVLFVWEAIRNGWLETINESIVLTDTQAVVLGLLISDWITLVDSQTNNWNGRDTINDSVYLYDLADKYFRIADTVNESVELADTTTYKLTIAVLEYLGFTELATAMRSTAATVNESLALTETQSYAWAELIQEALSVVDAATVIATFVDVVQESLNAADTVSLINRLGLSLDESLVFAETVTSKGTLYNAVYDTMKMSVTVELGGEVYECYVLNTPKFMPSMYSGFNFNSYCVFENRAFGANDTGIYELTGTTDAGSTIHTGAILSQTDFGARNEKRFRRAYLGISGTAPVMIFETEEGARQVYNINSEGKTVISHELKSRKWKLSIADFDELDTMKLIPVILSK